MLCREIILVVYQPYMLIDDIAVYDIILGAFKKTDLPDMSRKKRPRYFSSTIFFIASKYAGSVSVPSDTIRWYSGAII